jgi:hypothetical protein
MTGPDEVLLDSSPGPLLFPVVGYLGLQPLRNRAPRRRSVHPGRHGLCHQGSGRYDREIMSLSGTLRYSVKDRSIKLRVFPGVLFLWREMVIHDPGYQSEGPPTGFLLYPPLRFTTNKMNIIIIEYQSLTEMQGPRGVGPE